MYALIDNEVGEKILNILDTCLTMISANNVSFSLLFFLILHLTLKSKMSCIALMLESVLSLPKNWRTGRHISCMILFFTLKMWITSKAYIVICINWWHLSFFPCLECSVLYFYYHLKLVSCICKTLIELYSLIYYM